MCLFIIWASTVSALGIEINPMNYSSYLATQGGVFSADSASISIKSETEQSIILVKTADIHNKVSLVEFSGTSYKLPWIVLLWKLKGQEYTPSNQMQLAIKNGRIRLEFIVNEYIL